MNLREKSAGKEAGALRITELFDTKRLDLVQ